MQALVKLVVECSAQNESPLKIALFSLAKMCAHAKCRQVVYSSELLPAIGKFRQSPDIEIAKYASVVMSRVTQP